MKKQLTVFSLTFFSIIFLLVNLSYGITCQVTRVLDGDTFHCIPEKLQSLPPEVKIHKDGTLTVRLRGIDAPEKRQPFGEEAQSSLKSLIGNKSVKLQIREFDKYGRVVAYVWLGTLNVNLEQIKKGYAWAYTQYLDRPYISEFYEAERQARTQKLGLWEQSNPTPPWEWRKKKQLK